jgi:RNA polymerase-binding transcription factor DksA
MDTIHLLSLKDKLIKRRERVELTLRNLEIQEHAQEENSSWIDPYPRPQHENSFIDLDLWYRQEMNQLEYALERMEAETYGQCLGCGITIEGGRLEQCPETEFCGACQTLWEKMRHK